MSPAGPVPTTLIAGALGVGKTSAILSLAEQQPDDERWVVLVNEVGEVGVDGLVLDGGAGLSVEELAGGCLCCTGRGPMRTSLAQVLARTQPDRLIVEPSGVADLGRVLDLVRLDFADRLALRATITLVDPRAAVSPGPGAPRRGAAWQQQVDAADILVANKLDLCDADTVQAFLDWGSALFPPKLQVVTTVGGELDPAWLALEPGPRPPPSRVAYASPAPVFVDQTGLLPPGFAPQRGPDHGTVHHGWRWPRTQRFSSRALADIARTLVAPGPWIAAGAARVKGVFHTDQGWQLLQADVDGVRWTATGWRGDSRLEVIADARPGPDWASLAAALDEATLSAVAPAGPPA